MMSIRTAPARTSSVDCGKEQGACALRPVRPLGRTQKAALCSRVKMASRPAVAASGRWLEGIRKWYYNAAGFNKLGLMRDDTIYEDEDVKEAVRRLPENLYNDRMFRIKRALDLTMRQQILPKEQWTKYEEDKFYLEPYLKEVIRERKEREEWGKK
ncbi:cytochrome b-c1 complex subunit 7 [Ictidomys tridecemlineatus]|nr:cytochrome b-c1 complex subunit 7 isoform X1 [Ictidomys tridecemlineatus]KAG3273868.1 cytochrome b-c1 complex subunit 7 [Ictidomys tridecemlineatus]